VLKDFPDVKVEVCGHTDSDGDREHNVDLSQRRADAVKKYLVDKGIDTARISTRGAGPDQPIADNTTKDGKAKNRRIEFKLQ
jgi:outer membrane protein OmpA-like peptidoglycan-associated protein